MHYFGNLWTTRVILERFPAVKQACDFSHWLCVARWLLEDCREIILLAAQHCQHVHARVGYEAEPGVPDPRASAWAYNLAAHEKWWDLICTLPKQRGMVTASLGLSSAQRRIFTGHRPHGRRVFRPELEIDSLIP